MRQLGVVSDVATEREVEKGQIKAQLVSRNLGVSWGREEGSFVCLVEQHLYVRCRDVHTFPTPANRVFQQIEHLG